MDILNYIIAALSIGLGLFGWLAPKYTLGALELTSDQNSTMGMSEIRASAGCLFVGLGIGALFIGTPIAYAMVGFAWGGAAIGRATSLIFDGTSRKKWTYFWVEAIVAIIALWINF